MTGPKPEFDRVRRGFKLILQGLGLDLESPHVRDTPERAARAWFSELSAGLTGDPPDVTMFPEDGDRSSLILSKRIPVRSFCSHHLLPFFGTAVVGYIPGNGEILGLSKLSRITNYWARRPQVQERLTEQIADDLWERVRGEQKTGQAYNVGVCANCEHEFGRLGQVDSGARCPECGKVAKKTKQRRETEAVGGVGAVIRARHMCMELRGVEHEGEMVTSALRGALYDKPEARAEFLDLAGVRGG